MRSLRFLDNLLQVSPTQSCTSPVPCHVLRHLAVIAVIAVCEHLRLQITRS